MSAPDAPNPIQSNTPPQAPDVSSKQTSEQASMSKTQFSSMGELKKEAPEVVKAMMEGIAFRIISQMKKHAKRMKKILRESRRG